MSFEFIYIRKYSAANAGTTFVNIILVLVVCVATSRTRKLFRTSLSLFSLCDFSLDIKRYAHRFKPQHAFDKKKTKNYIYFVHIVSKNVKAHPQGFSDIISYILFFFFLYTRQKETTLTRLISQRRLDTHAAAASLYSNTSYIRGET